MAGKAYYEQRTAASRELLRLGSEGIYIDAKALQWARDTSKIQRPTGRRPGKLSTAILDMLQKVDPAVGLMCRHVMAAHPEIAQKPVSTTLCRMSQCGVAFRVRVGPYLHHFPTAEMAAAAKPGLMAEFQRQLDQTKENTRARDKKRNEVSRRAKAPAKPVEPAVKIAQTKKKPEPKKSQKFTIKQAQGGLSESSNKYDERFKAQKTTAKKVPAQIIGMDKVKITVCPPTQAGRALELAEPVAGGFVAEWRARRAGGME